jgi:serine/threonine-protein kinase
MVLAGRYRLDAKLGEGGMGVVWAATHVVTRQTVALKLLLTTPGADTSRVVKRFMREARAASAVKHPNVVLVYDVMELDAQTPMMVMELLRGETLGQRLDRERTLPLGEVARVLLPVVSALGTAHAAGIVHRDIKPDNIFLAVTPEGPTVKVLDFGIAKLLQTAEEPVAAGTLTATNAIVGTPYYMAPEQVFGEKDIDHRADVWALGIIAYECLAGTRPADGDNVGQIMKIIATHRIVPIDRVVAGLPADVASIIMNALTEERSARPSLKEMKAVLEQYTSLHVRDFSDPRAVMNVSSSDSSDQALPLARTVASGEREATKTSPTADTLLDASVTHADRPKPTTTRWATIAFAAAAVAAASVLSVVLATRAHPPAAPAAPPATTTVVSVSPPVVTAAPPTSAPTQEDVPAASTVVAQATRPPTAPHAKPSASAAPPATTAAPKSAAKLEHGGVVETVPY